MDGAPTGEETYHDLYDIYPEDGPSSLSPRRHFNQIMAGAKEEVFMLVVLQIKLFLIGSGYFGYLLWDAQESSPEEYRYSLFGPYLFLTMLVLANFALIFIFAPKLLSQENSFDIFSYICDVGPRYKLKFPTYSDEKLAEYFDCYLFMSTSSSEPLIPGILYLSDSHLAFCCDLPLPITPPSLGQTWTYYKVMVRLTNISTVSTVIKGENPLDKWIQIATFQGHEFWFTGFEDYTEASTQIIGIISGA